MATGREFVIVVPGSPKSVNHGGGGVRSNPYAAGREKRRWQDTFANELMAARVPRGMSFCKVDIVVRFRYRNRRDVENLRHPIVKPLADALSCGWLPDDTSEFFEVGEFSFEYPQVWHNFLVKSEMVLRLVAVYP